IMEEYEIIELENRLKISQEKLQNHLKNEKHIEWFDEFLIAIEICFNLYDENKEEKYATILEKLIQTMDDIIKNRFKNCSVEMKEIWQQLHLKTLTCLEKIKSNDI
ncbi:MAG: hypothetical protein RLY43_1598, partial [Bacteroidota bacterium]